MKATLKRKLKGLSIAALAVIGVSIGVLTNTNSIEAAIGTVPGKDCTSVSLVNRIPFPEPGSSFTLNNDGSVTARFVVKGDNTCREKVSLASWQAPNGTDGRPFSEQKFFKSSTTVVGAGTHSLTVPLPPCFFQTDLVLGGPEPTPGQNDFIYGPDRLIGAIHGGTKPCVPQPTPSAACQSLEVAKIDRTKFRLNATATTAGGAMVSGYNFAVYRADNATTPVFTRNVTTSALNAAVETPDLQSGDYVARVTVKTSLGDRISNNCIKRFTVEEAPAKPTAECKALSVIKLERTKFRLTGSAAVTGGATVKGYNFAVYRADNANTPVFTKDVTTGNLSANVETTSLQPGSYVARVTVKTSLGDRISNNCIKRFTVEDQPTKPAIKVNKLVNGKDHQRVGVNVEFTYQIAVTNTGNADLKNVVVTDNAPQGVTFISASQGTVTDNKWSFTIPALKQGETMRFTIKAKVPVFLAGVIKNTVCVDTPDISGNPDDCDDATVDVPKEDEMLVCDLKTNKVITIKKSEFNSELHSTNLADCEMQVCDLETQTIITINKSEFDETKHSTNMADCDDVPAVLGAIPSTGPADIIVKLAGVASLTGATAYYLASRRQLLG